MRPEPVLRVVRIPLYWVIVGVFLTVASPILSVMASVNIAERNSEQIILQREKQREAARQEARSITCAFLTASLDAYEETPPVTPTGRNLRQKYVDLYEYTGCQPPRK